METRNGEGTGQNMRFSDIVLDDSRLSLAAKGLFAALGLLGNRCSVAELAERTSDGETSIRKALTELQRAGYVEITGDMVVVQTAGSFGISE